MDNDMPDPLPCIQMMEVRTHHVFNPCLESCFRFHVFLILRPEALWISVLIRTRKRMIVGYLGALGDPRNEGF